MKCKRFNRIPTRNEMKRNERGKTTLENVHTI